MKTCKRKKSKLRVESAYVYVKSHSVLLKAKSNIHIYTHLLAVVTKNIFHHSKKSAFFILELWVLPVILLWVQAKRSWLFFDALVVEIELRKLRKNSLQKSISLYSSTLKFFKIFVGWKLLNRTTNHIRTFARNLS